MNNASKISIGETISKFTLRDLKVDLVRPVPDWYFPLRAESDEDSDNAVPRLASQPSNADAGGRAFFMYSQAINCFLIWLSEKYPQIRVQDKVCNCPFFLFLTN